MIQRKAIDDASFNKLLKLLPKLDLTNGPFVAGGAARRLWYDQDWARADVDVFFVNEQQRLDWVKQFEHMRYVSRSSTAFDAIGDLVLSRRASTYKSISTANADTYVIEMDNVNIKLQTIKTRYSLSFLDLFRDFDFAASCFATDGTCVVALDSALRSVEQKQLIINNDANTHNMPLRVLKYQIYGFDPSDDVLRSVADQIANGEVSWESNY